MGAYTIDSPDSQAFELSLKLSASLGLQFTNSPCRSWNFPITSIIKLTSSLWYMSLSLSLSISVLFLWRNRTLANIPVTALSLWMVLMQGFNVDHGPCGPLGFVPVTPGGSHAGRRTQTDLEAQLRRPTFPASLWAPTDEHHDMTWVSSSSITEQSTAWRRASIVICP